MWAKKEYIDALPEDSVPEVRKQKKDSNCAADFSAEKKFVGCSGAAAGSFREV